MQFFVRNINGITRLYTLDIDSDIEQLKETVEDYDFIPSGIIRMVHGTQPLVSGSLRDYNITDGSLLEVMLNVNGGMRGKWRKKRMRRLRRMRRKMRQRAR